MRVVDLFAMFSTWMATFIAAFRTSLQLKSLVGAACGEEGRKNAR